MLNSLQDLPPLLLREPHRAEALVASGVFDWDTEITSSTMMPRLSQNLFHTVVQSEQSDPTVVQRAHAWFLTQENGAKRWDALLWGHDRTLPVMLAFSHHRLTMASALSDAMLLTRARPAMNDPWMGTATWLARWHAVCAGKFSNSTGDDKFERWAQSATWLSEQGWVNGADAWFTLFENEDSGTSINELNLPLTVAARHHGRAGLEHLLDLGAQPRGLLPTPVSSNIPERPLLYILLQQWCLMPLPFIVQQHRQAEMETLFTLLVARDWDALSDQTVDFKSPFDWPHVQQADGLSIPLYESERLTDEERAMLRERLDDPRVNNNAAPLPLTLLLRGVGPAPVQALFEQDALHRTFDALQQDTPEHQDPHASGAASTNPPPRTRARL